MVVFSFFHCVVMLRQIYFHTPRMPRIICRSSVEDRVHQIFVGVVHQSRNMRCVLRCRRYDTLLRPVAFQIIFFHLIVLQYVDNHWIGFYCMFLFDWPELSQAATTGEVVGRWTGRSSFYRFFAEIIPRGGGIRICLCIDNKLFSCALWRNQRLCLVLYASCLLLPSYTCYMSHITGSSG